VINKREDNKNWHPGQNNEYDFNPDEGNLTADGHNDSASVNETAAPRISSASSAAQDTPKPAKKDGGSGIPELDMLDAGKSGLDEDDKK
jgi:hypothetical protein